MFFVKKILLFNVAHRKLVILSFAIPFYYGSGSTKAKSYGYYGSGSATLAVDIDESHVFLKNICCVATQTTLRIL
jgi:hypothetical protein